MDATEFLTQYLYEAQYKDLRSNEAYQAARDAVHQAEKNLIDVLSPEQTDLFYTYVDQVSRLDTLERNHFFARCTLRLIPRPIVGRDDPGATFTANLICAIP